jgi:threonine/homoserine/homoserine lactone efflux protein
MPSTPTFATFMVASLLLLMIPGPAVLFIVTRSSTQGRRAGLVSVAGVHTASTIHVIAATVGLSALIVASANAFTAIKVIGGLYLIYLGIRALRAHPPATTQPAAAWPQHRLFTQAFVVNFLNPKVAIFFLAFLPQFVHHGNGPIWAQTLILGATYIALGICSDSLYAIAAARIARQLTSRRSTWHRARIAEGTILIALGITSFAIPHQHSTK